jgi:hypothetical protein
VGTVVFISRGELGSDCEDRVRASGIISAPDYPRHYFGSGSCSGLRRQVCSCLLAPVFHPVPVLTPPYLTPPTFYPNASLSRRSSRGPAPYAPFDQPFYLIFNLAVGGWVLRDRMGLLGFEAGVCGVGQEAGNGGVGRVEGRGGRGGLRSPEMEACGLYRRSRTLFDQPFHLILSRVGACCRWELVGPGA